MSILISKTLSQMDKVPIVNSAITWYSTKKDCMDDENRRASISDDTSYQELFRPNTPHGSPRYSIAPPPYEKVVETPTIVESSRFTNTISTIWKRASFSSGATNQSVKESATTTPDPFTIDKKQVEHAMTLIKIATEMNNGGNHQMAVDLYMMGLDKIISALPLESDPSIKTTLERRLSDLKEHHKLNIVSLQDILGKKQETEEEEDESVKNNLYSQISELFINAAVQSAIALKRSPIPDTVSSLMNNTIDLMQLVDQNYKVRQRTWNLASYGVSKAIEIDRQYEIHQMITGTVYTGIAAIVKASIAYAETPKRQ